MWIRDITLILIAIFSIIAGLFVSLRPLKTIDIQKKFYLKINWRIEPVSLQKEIRNTRIMGYSLVILGLLTIILTIYLK